MAPKRRFRARGSETNEADGSHRLVVGSPNGEHVTIEVLHRSYPEATDADDGKWLNAEVSVRLRAFRGRVTGYLRTDDFPSFREQVARLYEGVLGGATFETMEEWLRCHLVGDGRGRIETTVVVLDAPGIGNQLRGNLRFDQTHLPNMIRALDNLAQAFPSRGACWPSARSD